MLWIGFKGKNDVNMTPVRVYYVEVKGVAEGIPSEEIGNPQIPASRRSSVPDTAFAQIILRRARGDPETCIKRWNQGRTY